MQTQQQHATARTHAGKASRLGENPLSRTRSLYKALIPRK